MQWLEVNMFEPLLGGGSTRKRVSSVTDRLREFYAGSTKSCLLEMLSIRGSSEELQSTLKAAMQNMRNALTRVEKESGIGPAAARSKAEDAIVLLEGSLILARVLGDAACFERVLKSLPDLLTAA